MRGLIIQAVSFCCFSFHLAMGDRLDCMRNLPVWVHKKTLPIIDRKGELALYHLRLHRSIYMHINSNASCPVTWTNRKNLCRLRLSGFFSSKATFHDFCLKHLSACPKCITILRTGCSLWKLSSCTPLSYAFKYLPVSFYNIKVHWVICQYDFSIIIMTFTWNNINYLIFFIINNSIR